MNRTTIDALNTLTSSLWVGNVFADYDGTIYYHQAGRNGFYPTRLTASRGKVRVETLTNTHDGSHWEWEDTYTTETFRKMIEAL